MRVAQLFEATERFAETINAATGVLNFKYRKFYADKSFKEIFREEIPGPGLSLQSGVYLFSYQDDSVLYIGKAGSNNLGDEIYKKFKASTTKEGYFGNSPMAEYAKPEDADKLRNGIIKVHAIAIEPKEMVSLVEVYLQTYCMLETGALPNCNKRIG